jgi:bacteriorhodopsin
VTWALLSSGRNSTKSLGGHYQRSFTITASLLTLFSFLYPIAWALSEGGNVISTDSEMVFYAVLDVLSQPLLLTFHLYQLSHEDLASLQLYSGKFTDTSLLPTVAKKTAMESTTGPEVSDISYLRSVCRSLMKRNPQPGPRETGRRSSEVTAV